MNSPSSEVGPSDDVVRALLEYLVDPILPLKSSSHEAPSLPQQQSIAKQVHAVVLLYNYYQRKRHPEVEFLGFESFCRLVVTLRPTLMAYMKLMQQSDYTEADDLENQLSVTENAIVDACNISLVLDASKDVPNTEGWPICKVAVLLIDSRKENCLLLFSSITHGVWSVIEKDLDVSNINSESAAEGKHISKRKRITKKPLINEQDGDDTGFQQHAFSAIKDATGIKQTDLLVLESHIVYSLSQEKTAARFYIVQCTQTSNQDLQVPIKDAIESLHGPLVKKSSRSWMVTPVLEYYHLLPYAGIMSGWLSRKCHREVFSNNVEDIRVGSRNVNINSSERSENPCEKEVTESKEMSSNGLQDLSVGLENVNVNSPQRMENSCDKEVIENMDKHDKNCNMTDFIDNKASDVSTSPRTKKACDNETVEKIDKSVKSCEIATSSGNKASGANTKSRKWKENDECHIACLSNSSNAPQSMDIHDSSVIRPLNEDKNKNARMTIRVYHHQKKRISKQSDIIAPKVKAEVADSNMKSQNTECRSEKVDTENKICSTNSSDQGGMLMGDYALVPFRMNSEHLEKLQLVLASKQIALSQTALRALLKKREELSYQLRILEDEIAVCDKNINTIVDGGEDDLALKIEAIMDCCNDACLNCKSQNQERTQNLDGQGSSPYTKGKKLSEAILTSQTPCQRLDDICYENNWLLPTYRVSPSDGGFLADVNLKGVDFEYSGGSNLRSSPREARESAAEKMITKLRTVRGQLH